MQMISMFRRMDKMAPVHPWKFVRPLGMEYSV